MQSPGALAVGCLVLHKFLSIQSRASARPHCSANAAVGKDLLTEITRCAATVVQFTSTIIVKPELVESSVAVISTSQFLYAHLIVGQLWFSIGVPSV
jgi:hypothetical protein